MSGVVRVADRPARVFLTGGSGVVGRALLDRLGPERVTCLVHRTPLDVPCRQVHGDIAKPRLGLDEGEFAALALQTDAIVHAAALTGFHERPRDVERVNVAALDGILELAAAAVAPVCHVSTAFVSRRRPDVARGVRVVGTAGYVESKVAGEEAMRRSGQPHAIVRPSVILGDSTTGYISQFQGLHALAGYLMRGQLPLIPLPREARIDFVAQDTVANAIALLVDSASVSGEHWITAGPRALTAAEMVEIGVEVAAERGRTVTAPELVERERAEQMLVDLGDRLPTKLKRRFESLLELTSAFGATEPMPTSLPALGLGSGPSPAEVFARSCAYWADCNGIGEPSRAPAVQVGG